MCFWRFSIILGVFGVPLACHGAPVGPPSGPLGGHFAGPGIPLGLFWSGLV